MCPAPWCVSSLFPAPDTVVSLQFLEISWCIPAQGLCPNHSLFFWRSTQLTTTFKSALSSHLPKAAYLDCPYPQSSQFHLPFFFFPYHTSPSNIKYTYLLYLLFIVRTLLKFNLLKSRDLCLFCY